IEQSPASWDRSDKIVSKVLQLFPLFVLRLIEQPPGIGATYFVHASFICVGNFDHPLLVKLLETPFWESRFQLVILMKLPHTFDVTSKLNIWQAKLPDQRGVAA